VADPVSITAIDDRNRMVHDYSNEFAGELFERIKAKYLPAFKRLSAKLVGMNRE
jgi:hypothetical protein